MRLLFSVMLLLVFFFASVPDGNAQTVNVPYFGSDSRMNEAAIFWFGQVDNQHNYADIRLGYNDLYLKIYFHVIDRFLWYNTAGGSDADQWDSVTLLLQTQLNTVPTINPTTYKFIRSLSWWEPASTYERAYQGTVTGSWQTWPVTDYSQTGYRGNAPNDTVDDRGWTVFFTIPWSALNLTSPPLPGTVWKIAAILNDRDGLTTPPNPPEAWPPIANVANPTTWSNLHFGPPSSTSVPLKNPVTLVLRSGLSFVSDAEVGGHTNCGGDSSPDFFPTWGFLNYAGSPQIVEQNQWDISDWPCFSKLLFNFDLTSLPKDKVVNQAKLLLHQFGNSDPTQAKPSYIQVLSTHDSWDEATVNWNNAPKAAENIAAAWVDPVSGPITWPGWRREWDVTYGLTQALAAHLTKANFILYSADGDYHSGKYFTASEQGDWNMEGRPTLEITLSDPVTPVPYDYDSDGDIDFIDLTVLLKEPFTIFHLNRFLQNL